MSDPFWRYARRMMRYRWQVLSAMVFAGLSAGGLGAGLVAIKPVVDNILGTNGERGKNLRDLARELNEKLPGWSPHIPESVIKELPPGAFDAVLWIVIGLGVLTILGAACNFMHAYLSLTVISRTVANIRREAFHRVVHLPLKTVVGKGPSDLVSRIVYDTATLGQGFNALLSRTIAQVTKGLVAIGVAFYYNWPMAACALLSAPVVGWILRKLGKRIRRASKRALEGQAGLYRSANEVVSGLRVVKVHTSERSEAGKFHRTNKEVVGQEFKVRTARALASPLVETVTIVVLGSLALVAVYAIMHGNIERGAALMVLTALGVAAGTLRPLTGFINDIQQATAASSRLTELLGMAPEPGHDAKLPKMMRHAKEIRFEDVRLTYPGAEKAALDGVSLTIEHGQTVAFVGPNGCGKTTLLSLIPRLFDPDAGCVFVDGRDIRQFAVRSLREQIGVVTQETVLFTGTVAENIAYGAAWDVSPEKIRDAARRARAEEFILQKPGGYEYRVGEGGSGLSGGQKQRMAIARAILRDPAILILDEATSMIDAESEAKIAEAVAEFVGVKDEVRGTKDEVRRTDEGGSGKGEGGVKSETRVAADGVKLNGTHGGAGGARGRTCLIVAHRLSTVIAADAIVVMDAGRIVDKGTHGELLSRCAIYQGLVANQMVSRPATEQSRQVHEGNEGGAKGTKGKG